MSVANTLLEVSPGLDGNWKRAGSPPASWPRVGAGLVLSLAGLIGMGALAGVAAEEFASRPLDVPVARAFANIREPWVSEVMRVVTQPGSSSVLLPLVGLVGVLEKVRSRSWLPALALATAYVGSLTLTRVVKVIVARLRPPQEDAAERFTEYAFPSGHAAKAIAVLLVLAAILKLGRDRRVATLIARSSAIVISLLVGVSRLFLGAHWLTDVVAGLILGAAWAVAILWFLPVRDARNSSPSGS